MRQAMREWINTGEVSIDDDDDEQPQPSKGGFEPREVTPNPVKAARTADERPTVPIAKGVKVSKKDLETFREMGGTMVRTEARHPIVFTEHADPLP